MPVNARDDPKEREARPPIPEGSPKEREARPPIPEERPTQEFEVIIPAEAPPDPGGQRAPPAEPTPARPARPTTAESSALKRTVQLPALQGSPPPREPAPAARPPIPEGEEEAPPIGRRSRRMAARRRTRRRRWFLLLLVAGVLLALLLARGGGFWPGSASGRGGQQTLLVVSRSPEPTGPVSAVTLLAAGPASAPATVLFLPVGTLMEIPGHGVDRLAAAYPYGGARLVAGAIETTLGIDVDQVVEVDDPGLPGLLGRMGGLELDLPEPLVQHAEPELTGFARQQVAYRALLTALEDRRTREATLAEGAPRLALDPRWARELFAALAAASAERRVLFTLLPVRASDRQGSYLIDEQGLAPLLAQGLMASAAGG